MKDDTPTHLGELERRRERRLEGVYLQEIEGNPLTASEVAMFEMFDRQGWDGDQRRAYIIQQFKRSEGQ